jgi:hypothetical protein
MKTVISRQYIVVSWILLSALLLSTIFYLLSTPALAQETPYVTPTPYNLLEPLPLGPNNEEVTTVTTQNYIPGLFRLIIGIAGVLAVVRIIWGGIQYMSTDAFQGKNDAKNTITNAIWGLLLAMTAWLIVYTINPKLVNFNLNIPRQTISSIPIPDNRGPESLALTHEQAYNQFRAASINVEPVLLAGIKQKTVDEVINLRRSCANCEIAVTSATGGTHAAGECSHANGYKVDLRTRDAPNLENFITSRYTLIVNPTTGQPVLRDGRYRVYSAPSGALYTREGNHWDVVVPCP